MPDNLKLDNPASRALRVDVAKYQAMIDDPSLSEDQKRDFIEALWQIIVAFVDLGFEVHPVQLACGQVENAAAENQNAAPDVLGSSQQPKSKFEAAARAERDERA